MRAQIPWPRNELSDYLWNDDFKLARRWGILAGPLSRRKMDLGASEFKTSRVSKYRGTVPRLSPSLVFFRKHDLRLCMNNKRHDDDEVLEIGRARSTSSIYYLLYFTFHF